MYLLLLSAALPVTMDNLFTSITDYLFTSTASIMESIHSLNLYNSKETQLYLAISITLTFLVIILSLRAKPSKLTKEPPTIMNKRNDNALKPSTNASPTRARSSSNELAVQKRSYRKSVNLPTDYTMEILADITSAECYLKKKSGKGVWQTRYFKTKGAYLLYYTTKDEANKAVFTPSLNPPLAAIDIRQITKIECSSKENTIVKIELSDTTSYRLQAPTNSIAEEFVVSLQLIQGKLLDGIKAAHAEAASTPKSSVSGRRNSSTLTKN